MLFLMCIIRRYRNNGQADRLSVSDYAICPSTTYHLKWCCIIGWLTAPFTDNWIERACTYLEQNYLKTYEIAYRVGFRDEKYFFRVFKKVKGMSPKEYRTGKSQEQA